MRRTSVLAAIIAVSALAAACEPEKATGAIWKGRACDQARIDLAKSHVTADNPTGAPLYRDSDSQTLDSATWELWHYEVTADSTATHPVNTLTTSEYYFEWGTQKASSAPNSCFRDTTVTVDTL